MTLLLPSAERLMQLSFPLAVELSCFFSPSLYCKSVCIIFLSSSVFLSVFLTLCLVVNVPLIAALPVSRPSPLSALVVVNVPAIVHFLESDLPPKTPFQDRLFSPMMTHCDVPVTLCLFEQVV